MGRFILKILGCAFAALLIGACEAPLSAPNQGASAAGQAIIRIGDNTPARSLVPDTAPVFTKYELVFTADGKDDVYRTLETTRDRNAINSADGYAVNLEEAAWTVTARAFVTGTSSTFLEAARGTASLTVNAGNLNPSALITLAPLSMNGEDMGMLTWNITLSGVSENVTVSGTITQVVDGEPIDNGTFLPSSFTGSKELPSGYYLLQFTLDKDSNNAAGVYRAVHIYPGLTTKAEGPDFTFTNEDFASEKYLSGTVTVTGAEGRTVESMKVQLYQLTNRAVPLTAVDVAADGSWSLSIPGNINDVYFNIQITVSGFAVVDISGGTETGIPANGKNDIVLSAAWNDVMYTVSFNAGLGTGTPPLDQKVAPGASTAPLPGQEGMTAPPNRTFSHWRINGQDYYEGSTFTVTGPAVAEAQWGVPGPKTPILNFQLESPVAFPSDDLTGYGYLFYVGTMENVFLSASNSFEYSGIGAMDWNFEMNGSTTNTTTVTNAVSQTIGISIAAGLKESLEIEAGGEAVGGSVKAGFELSLNVTESAEEEVSHSKTDTVERSEGWRESLVIPFTPANYSQGHYRRALYANKCDVYFAVRTDLTRQSRTAPTEVIVCVREADGKTVRLERSLTSTFPYMSPADLYSNHLTGDFWKNYARVPSLKTIKVPTPTATEFPYRDIRTGEVTVMGNGDNGGANLSNVWFQNYEWNNGFWGIGSHWEPTDTSKPMDTVNFSDFGINLPAMKAIGYKNVLIEIKLDITELDDGDQHIGIFKSGEWNTGHLLEEFRVDHDGDQPGNDPSTRWATYSMSKSLSIDKFTADSFVVRYKASGGGANRWKNKNLKIRITFIP